MASTVSKETAHDVPFPYGDDGWEPFRAIARQSRARAGAGASDDRVARLEDELELRAFQAQYVVALDSGDLDTVMSCFADDAVLINPRGTWEGADAIRRDYEHVLARSVQRMHFVTNAAVHVLDGRQEAWMAAYVLALIVAHDGGLTALAAMTAERLRRIGKQWRIVDRRVTGGIPWQAGSIAAEFSLPQ